MTNAERLAAIDEKLRVLDSDPNGVLALADEKWLAARVRELETENEKMRKELAGFYAAESRRYIEPTFCKVCPHALAFHNADGSCPCGSDCAALASPRRSA